MTARRCWTHNPRPSRAEIKKALTQNRNLCRCTGYTKIFEAIELAADRINSSLPQPSFSSSVDPHFGNPLVEAIAVDMVTGSTRFGDDLQLEDMLHGKILWSAHPHARILSVDTSEAEGCTGSRCGDHRQGYPR